MAFIRAAQLKKLLADIEDEAILSFDINPVTQKIEVGVYGPDILQGCGSGGCGTCETPCEAHKEHGNGD